MMNFKKSLSGVLRCKALTGLAAGLFSTQILAATTVYSNGQIYTMNPEQAWAQSVVVTDDRIVYVGDREGEKAYLDQGAQRIDLNGKLMLPGLIETHAHPVFGSVLASGLVFNVEKPNVDSYIEQIKSYLKANADAPVIFGFGFYADSFAEAGPRKEILDKLDDKRPIVFLDDGGHSAWANSKALALAGIDKHSKDPVPGVHFYRRDKNGEPTGYALETQAVEPLVEALGVYSAENVKKQLSGLMPMFPMLGYTTVFDAGMLSMTETGHQALQSLEQEGQLKTRMMTSLSLLDPRKASSAVSDLQSLYKKYKSDLVWPNTLKIHNDGTTEAETAAQIKPYLNDTSNYGGLILEGKSLADLVLSVDKAGFNIHIHSIGDRAIKEALDAFKFARTNNPNSSNRFSTAHTELVRPEDNKRFAQLDVVAQTTPLWFGMDRAHSARVLGKHRSSQLYSFADIYRSGGKVTFGSDFPVSGGLPGLVAMAQIESGMTRSLPGSSPNQAQPQAESAFSLDAMLRGYTIDAAYQINREKELGSIEVGKKADLIVMQENLFTLPPQKIHKAKIERTILNGELIYQRDAESAAMEAELGL
ncbi:amidohydrolase [uncultured Pseudoteredinibacter sp.]|uniref:amidohydrolase n=1 Tax=uncultured Pseudoteredinibacter sp. TaxID=1641701 RepID=UPI00261C79D0|nr:amidohydrolase [uncultured Pseudoteredinibacter sp.]